MTCTVHWRKSTNESEGKPEQKNSDVAFGTISDLLCIFNEASKNFSLSQGSLIISKHFAHVQRAGTHERVL
jgi:hypothetical protein